MSRPALHPLALAGLVVTLAAVPAARAQQPPPAPPVPALPQAEPPLRARIGAEVRRRALERVVELLHLDAPTAARLAELGDRYDARLAPYRRELRKGRRQLLAYTRSGTGDDATLNQLVDSVLVNQSSVHALEAERLRESRRLLTPRQFAQLVASLPQVKLEIQRDIGRALRRAAGDDDLDQEGE